MTFHGVAVAIFWVSRSAEALARTAMTVASPFPFQVGQHVRLSEEHVTTGGRFALSFALSELSFCSSFALSIQVV